MYLKIIVYIFIYRTLYTYMYIKHIERYPGARISFMLMKKKKKK